MRLKAIVKDGRIKFLEGEYNFPFPVTVEVDIPDETLESLTKVSDLMVVDQKEEHPLTQNIRKLMGNISRRPVDQAGSRDFDWRKEWQKHLEEKYGL